MLARLNAALNRLFKPGRLFPIAFWGILAAWSIFCWATLDGFGLVSKVWTVFEVVMFVLNVFVRWATWYLAKYHGKVVQ